MVFSAHLQILVKSLRTFTIQKSKINQVDIFLSSLKFCYQDKPWERKNIVREWDVGKGEKGKEDASKTMRDERPLDKRRHRSLERSPEPGKLAY